MKKSIAVLIALTVALSVTSCSSENQSAEEGEGIGTTTSSTSAATTSRTEAEPPETEETTEETTVEEEPPGPTTYDILEIQYDLDCTREEIIQKYGEPEYSNAYMIINPMVHYENGMEFYWTSYDMLAYLDMPPELLEFDEGETLGNMTASELSSFLDKRSMSGSYSKRYYNDGTFLDYFFTYPINSIVCISFYANDMDETVSSVTLSKHNPGFLYDLGRYFNLFYYNADYLVNSIGRPFAIIPNAEPDLTDYYYPEAIFTYDDTNGELYSVSLYSSNLVYDNNILYMTASEIRSFLGEPYAQNSNYLEYLYETDSGDMFSMTIDISAPDITRHSVTIEHFYGSYYPSGGSSSNSIVTADGMPISVGSTVFAQEGAIFSINYIEGQVVSINSANEIKVRWHTLWTNSLWTYKKYTLHEDTIWYYYYDSSGTKMNLTDIRSSYSADQLYSGIPSGGTVFN